MNNYWYLGVVRQSRFQVLRSESEVRGAFQLTSALPGAQPEPGLMSLAVEEGSALMVRGIDREEWIHAASIVDRAGPILTAVVEQVFAAPSSAVR
jgi:hypothetical protein